LKGGGNQLQFDEEKSLLNEIDTLRKDNERKARVILELYTLILKTEDINLIAEASAMTLKAQADEHLKN
jgi:hypothetical protein